MTQYHAVYPSGRKLSLAGKLTLTVHNGTTIPVIDNPDKPEAVALDPRAKIYETKTDRLVFDGTTVNPNFGK